MNSIFRHRNADVERLFNAAGRPEKVMCVALDYAKRDHTAAVCDGSGRRLRSAFNVRNNREGLDFLTGVVDGLCRKHKIAREHVFFGGEDCARYAFNFIHALASKGFLVVGINAVAAKHERDHSNASTDAIDTAGVAGMMVKKAGRTIGATYNDAYIIRRLRHQRDVLVKAQCASAHRLHSLVDELFPGFLDAKLSGLTPFSRASLWLMDERFSAAEVHARKRPALVKALRDFAVVDSEGAADKLRALADAGLSAPGRMIPVYQRCLRDELTLYRGLGESIHTMDADIAKALASTPGVMLTTVPGIGTRWAAALYSELADPLRRRHVDCLSALAGIVPRVKQTGGKDGPTVVGRRSRQCNHVLKRALVSAAFSVAEYGHAEMREAFRADEALGRDARMRMARRLLRICLCLADNGAFFLPPSLHKGGAPADVREYYAQAWPKVLVKWRDSGAILEAVAAGTPLKKWRDMAEELYGLDLSLKSPQYARK